MNFEFKKMSPKDLKPNKWNPNEMTSSDYEHLKKEIVRVGFLDPVTIMKDNLIVDGEHRWKAASELNLPEIPVLFLDIDNIEEAKLLTINLNKIKGSINPLRFSELLNNLGKTYNMELLQDFLNMSKKEIENYKILSSLEADVPAEIPQTEFNKHYTFIVSNLDYATTIDDTLSSMKDANEIKLYKLCELYNQHKPTGEVNAEDNESSDEGKD